MKEQNSKSESLIAIIASAIKKNAELPSSVNFILEKMQLIVDEVYKLKQHFASITLLVNQHSEILKNVVEIQEYILNNLHDKKKIDLDSGRVDQKKLNKLN